MLVLTVLRTSWNRNPFGSVAPNGMPAFLQAVPSPTFAIRGAKQEIQMDSVP